MISHTHNLAQKPTHTSTYISTYMMLYITIYVFTPGSSVDISTEHGQGGPE
jgi:hypothetical protein